MDEKEVQAMVSASERSLRELVLGYVSRLDRTVAVHRHLGNDGTAQLPRTNNFLDVRAISAATTAEVHDNIFLVDANSAAVTITLPKAAAAKNRYFILKKTDASANAATFDGNGSETIDGAATKATTTQYATITIISDGTTWHSL